MKQQNNKPKVKPMSEKVNKKADETKKKYSSNQASQYVKNLMNTKTTQSMPTPANEQPNVEIKDDTTIEENADLQNESEKQTVQSTRQRKSQPVRKSAVQSAYKDIFLTEGNLKERQSVYISRKIHLKLSNYLSVIAGKGFSIGVFIDNILNDHLTNYKSELDELYRTETEKLLNQ